MKSEHILEGQAELCAALAKFCHFESHTLYFPTSLERVEPQFLANERKVILPLVWQKTLLGVLVLQKVWSKEARSLLSVFPAIIAQILHSMALARALSRDPLTDLLRESALYDRMEEEVAIVKDPAMGAKDLSEIPSYRLCMGMIVLRLCNGDELALRCGYGFVDGILVACAKALLQHIPSNMLCTRAGKHEFGILFHATGREKCRVWAEDLLRVLQSLNFTNPLTKQNVHAIFASAFAYYPQDMRGSDLQLPMYEQSRMLRKRVDLACGVASPGHCLGYFEMLSYGGRIIEGLPLGRFRINLGRQMGVRVGDRFAVFGMGSRHAYKGDIQIVQARKKDAIGEIKFQESAGVLPEAGDRLEYAKDVKDIDIPEDTAIEIQSATAFYQEFTNHITNIDVFALCMVNIDNSEKQSLDNSIRTVLKIWQDIFENDLEQEVDVNKKPMLGLHGANILVIFHPKVTQEQLFDRYVDLWKRAKEAGIPCACGLAGYPLLSLYRNEIVDCTMKTLEYAKLLEDPKVGICNSLTFTISADKLMSLGDYFGAQEEYKRAINLDENNDLAWNSMGVCMAAMGRKDDARRHFHEALTHINDKERKAQILYNLGNVSQEMHDLPSAIAYFKECSENDPNHLYARIRIGQIYEADGKTEEAKKVYEDGVRIELAQHPKSTLAIRHLAVVTAKEKHDDEARALLQEALQRNPEDAAAMLLLARMYLESGENPSIVEMLARKSIRLKDSPDGWKILGRALRLMGRDDEAYQAEAQTMGK